MHGERRNSAHATLCKQSDASWALKWNSIYRSERPRRSGRRPTPLSSEQIATSIDFGADFGGFHLGCPQKNLLYFDPLPLPCPHLELIHTLKYAQPPLLWPLFQDPLLPPMRTSFLEADFFARFRRSYFSWRPMRATAKIQSLSAPPPPPLSAFSNA